MAKMNGKKQSSKKSGHSQVPTTVQISNSSTALKRLIRKMRKDMRKMETAADDLLRMIEAAGRTTKMFSQQLAQLQAEEKAATTSDK